MSQVKLSIDGQETEVTAGITILEAAKSAGIYIPTLCYHPDLPPAKGGEGSGFIYQGNHRIVNAMPEEMGKGCGICMVEVDGEAELVSSCATEVNEGMVVFTENDRIKTKRQENLIPILARHRHACLTCAQQEGCSRSQCSTNVPENERCCTLFGHCELQMVAQYVGISDSTPKWLATDLHIFKDDPLFERDYNLCIGCTRCTRACQDLRGIGAIGFVYDEKGLVQVGCVGPSLEESGCKFCTACVEVCPTGALIDKSVGRGRKEQDIVPCKEACPAHIDIPRYLRLIVEGKRDKANSVIREKVPFPGVLGRVCPHPCEAECRRLQVDEALAIRELKRFAADRVDMGGLPVPKIEERPEKVAVVGSGPAGLTVAYYLRLKGYRVTLFEALPLLGGMLRVGIPDYRLPPDVLDREIGYILKLGVEVQTGKALGSDFSLADLEKEGFKAIFLGIGAHRSLKLNVPGEGEFEGLLDALDFLREVNLGKREKPGKRVVIIGGGNVAIDTARTALRLGSEEVNIFYRRSRQEMPAYPEEIEDALAEGVRINYLTAPVRILGVDGKVNGFECIRTELGPPDASGRRRPVPVEGSEFVIECDAVIPAIGQASDLSFLGDNTRISVNKGFIVVNSDTLETGMKGVYAGGNVASAPDAIIHAIAAGRKAASSIDKTLGGTGEIDEILCERESLNQYLGKDEEFTTWPREICPEIGLEGRHQGFEEVSLGYSDEQAVNEAKRCLQCDLRLLLGSNPSPPEKVLAFNEENVNQVTEGEGVFKLYDEDRETLLIQGTSNLREGLLEALEENAAAVWFDFEEDKMYSKRESELIQQYLQEHGEMPGGGDSDLDDLF